MRIGLGRCFEFGSRWWLTWLGVCDKDVGGQLEGLVERHVDVQKPFVVNMTGKTVIILCMHLLCAVNVLELKLPS